MSLIFLNSLKVIVVVISQKFYGYQWNKYRDNNWNKQIKRLHK